MEHSNSTIREHIKQLKDQEGPRKLPYQLEGRPGKFTTITTEQRMMDSDIYCDEVKTRLLQNLKQGSLPFAQDTLFMHDAVFDSNDHESPFQKGKTSGIKRPWWEDDDFLADENVRDPESKVRKYLRDSST